MLCKLQGMEKIWVQSYPGLDVALLPWGDNVFYVMIREGAAIAVDPPVAEPVRRVLRARHARLSGIWITHHDPDHVGGVPELSGNGIAIEEPSGADRSFEWQGLEVQALDTPGHRRSHTAFYLPKPDPGLLFSGDCLFASGCGRLNGLPPGLMYGSLRKLMALPDETHVYCGHDYLESNLAFALAEEPGNEAMIQRLNDIREKHLAGEAVLPSTIGMERATNPFVRARSLEEFSARRARKDRF